MDQELTVSNNILVAVSQREVKLDLNLIEKELRVQKKFWINLFQVQKKYAKKRFLVYCYSKQNMGLNMICIPKRTSGQTNL